MVKTERKLRAEHFSRTDHETGKADAGEIPRARDSASAPVSECVHRRTKVKFQGVHTSKVEGYVWSSRLALLFSREELPARSPAYVKQLVTLCLLNEFTFQELYI